MNPKKINQFKLLLNAGKLEEASKLIPEILTYPQYRSFCLKTKKYLSSKNRKIDSLIFRNAHTQTVMTEAREQELLDVESKYKLAEEDVVLNKTICEDAEASFEIMSERAAKIFDKDILSFAMIELVREDGDLTHNR